MAGKKKEDLKEEKQTRKLEESMAELEAVMDALNQPEIALEESFGLYKKGMDLLLECNQAIDKVEKELMILEENGIGDEL